MNERMLDDAPARPNVNTKPDSEVDFETFLKRKDKRDGKIQRDPDGSLPRWHNGHRTLESNDAKAVGAEVTNQLLNLEKYLQPDRRRRTPAQMTGFTQTAAGVIADVTHRELTSEDGSIAVAMNNNKVNRASQYKMPTDSKHRATVIDLMAHEHLQFLERERGIRGYGGTPGRTTTIKAGPRLLTRIYDNCIELSDLGLDSTQQIVMLKDEIPDGSPPKTPRSYAEYDDTELTIAIRAKVKAINEYIDRSRVRWSGDFTPHHTDAEGHQYPVDTSDLFLRRYFNNGRFDHGGRLFGGYWQNLRKIDRQHITIGGERVITLDYSQMAPKLLYSLAGIPHGLSNQDAYTLEGFEDCRDAVKKVFNAMLFTRRPLTRMPIGVRELLPSDRKVTLKEIVSGLKKVHEPVVRSFNTGIGYTLQHSESEILITLLLQLAERGITALPIHDAVIVREKDRKAVEQAMKTVFWNLTGSLIDIHLDG